MSKQPLIANLEHIDGTKELIRDVLESKGVKVSDEDTFRSYASKMEQLSSEASIEEFKEVTPKTVAQTVLPSEGYKAIKQVAINAVTSDIDEDLKPENIKKDVDILGVLGTYEVKLQDELQVTPSTETQFIAPEEGFDGIKQVNVKPVTAEIDEDIQSKNIKKGVNILGVEGELESNVLQYNKDIRPSREMQFLTPDNGADGVRNMTVYPVTRLIDENIQPENIRKGVEIMGVEGTVDQYVLEEYKVVTPTKEHQTITPSSGCDALRRVEILAANKDIDENIKPENIKEGAVILGVRGTYDGVEDLDLQIKTVNPTSDDGGVDVTYDSNYDALAKVHINPIKASMVRGLSPDIIKKGEKVLEMTGTYGEKSQVKVVTPTTSDQTVYPDEGVKFLEHVIVSGVNRSIDSDIQAANIRKGVEILGVTGTYEGDSRYQNKTASLNTEEVITYTADSGYDALASVTVPRVTSAIDSDIKPENIRKGIEILDVTGTYEPAPSMSEKRVTPKDYEQLVYPDSGYASIDKVRVSAVNSSIDSAIISSNIRKGVEILGVYGNVEAMNPQQIFVQPSTERQEITPDEEHNCINKVVAYPVTSEIDENIISSNIKEGINILGVEGTFKGDAVALQTKVVTPKDVTQEITADEGYDALSVVTVNPPEQEEIEVNPSIEEFTVYKNENKFIKSVTVNPVSSDIDRNIQAENIRKNISILGVVGNYDGTNSDASLIETIKKGESAANFKYSHISTTSYTYRVPGIVTQIIEIPGNLAVSGTSLDYAFEHMTSLIKAPNIDFTEVTSAERIFNACTSLTYENIPRYASGKVKNWSMSFAGCTSLSRVPELDYSSADSCYCMFVDSAVSEIPANLMELFPKITSMEYMFSGCPIGGDLELTIGSQYHRDSNIVINCSKFAASDKYGSMTLNIASKLKFSGGTSKNLVSSSGIPQAKVENIINYVDGGYISYLYCFAPTISNDVTWKINSSNTNRNYDFNLVGCTDTSYLFAKNYSSGTDTDLYISCPDTADCRYMFYGATYYEGTVYMHIGSACTQYVYAFKDCRNLVSILPYEEGKPVMDASACINVYSAFYNCSALVDFEGLTDFGKAFTSKSNNYSNYTLNLSSCTSLSVESLRSIIDKLYDLNITYGVYDEEGNAGTGTLYRQSLVLGATNLAKLTDEEIAVATNKGWNVT